MISPIETSSREPPEPRPSIEERAARRSRIQGAGSDRYSSLVRALRAGREIPWQRRRTPRFEWHPIAWTLVRLIAAVIVAYLLVTTALNLWREQRVDTWSGPDASVSSGQRLEGCSRAADFHDPIFPAWVRFEGKVFGGTPNIRPVGSNVDNAYPVTGYRLGALNLLRVTTSPEGLAGRMIVLKLDSSLTGQVYVLLPECE